MVSFCTKNKIHIPHCDLKDPAPSVVPTLLSDLLSPQAVAQAPAAWSCLDLTKSFPPGGVWLWDSLDLNDLLSTFYMTGSSSSFRTQPKWSFLTETFPDPSISCSYPLQNLSSLFFSFMTPIAVSNWLSPQSDCGPPWKPELCLTAIKCVSSTRHKIGAQYVLTK